MSSILWMCVNVFAVVNTYSPPNYVYNGDYTLSQSNWEATCQFYYDGHLASIHKDSQRVEAQTASGTSSWIGLNGYVTSGTWMWTDGTAFNYGLIGDQPPWGAGEPNDGEDCAKINGNGLWNDVPCSTLNHGLCAYPIPITVINDKSSYERTRQHPGYIGMIDILDEIYIDFYITFHSWPTMWGNILQFGDSDARRYPGIYVYGPTKNIQSSFTTVTAAYPDQSITTSGYSLNTEYHYTLYQTQRRLTVTFGGDYVYDDIYDYSGGTGEVSGVAVSHPIVMNQAINVGSIWADEFDATIRNLVVTTANSPETTFWNYLCDWDDRWTTRNGGSYGWGAIGGGIDGDCSVRQADTAAASRHAWIGEKDPDSLLWTDYKIEMIINLISGNSVGPLFRATNLDCNANNCGNAYLVRMMTDCYEFVKLHDTQTILYTHSMGAGAHSLGTPYLVRVECVGNTFKIYEENEYLFNYSDASYAAGSVGFRTATSDARISKVRITFPQNQQRYTASPSAAPSSALTTSVPTSVPTTVGPSKQTEEPTFVPTKYPSKSPSKSPTDLPTKSPTFAEKQQEESTTNSASNDYESHIAANQKDSNSGLYIAVSIIVICFVFGVFALCFYKFRKKKRLNKSIIDRVSSVSHVEMSTHSGDNNDSGLVKTIMGKVSMTDMVMADMRDVDIDDIKASNDDDDVLEMVNSFKTSNGIIDNLQGVDVVEFDGGYIDGNNFMSQDFAAKQIIDNEPGSIPKHAENGLVEGIDYDINEDGAKEINLWLDSIGLLRYYDTFIKNGFDSLEMVQEISDENDLNKIGVTLIAHQFKIINHIKKIRR